MTIASGVEVDENCVHEYNNIKLGKKYKYIIYQMSDDMKKIIVGKKSEKNATYQDLCDELAKVEKDMKCCYAVVDMDVLTKSGATAAKLALISWCPDTAYVRQKMIYTSSIDSFKKKLGTGYTCYQANDISELEEKDLVEKLAKTN